MNFMPKGADVIKYSNLTDRVLCGEEILFSSLFDVSENGDFIDGFFAVSEKTICVIENGKVIRVEKICAIEKAVCAEYIGGGMIEVFTKTGRYPLVRFSMEYIEAFTRAADIINDLADGIDVINADEGLENETICPKCRAPFIPGTHVCAHCTDKKSIIKRLWALSKPCRGLYGLLLIFFWISSVSAVASPMLSRWLINDVLNIENASFKTLYMIVGLMLLLSIVTALVSVGRDIVSSKASNLLVMDLRNHIYEKLQGMPLSYIEKKKTGDLMQRINSDTLRIQVFIQDIAIMAINEVCLFIAIAAVTFYLDAVMALLIFLPMPPAMWLIGKIRRSIQRRYRKQWGKLDTLTNRLTEVINGIKVVKVFGREDDEIARFGESAASVRDLTCKNEKFVYTIFPIIKFIMSFGAYFVLLYGGSKVIGGGMSVGELVQFSSYGSYLYSKLEWFSMLPRHFTMALVSSQRVFEVLDETQEEAAGDNAHRENIQGGFDFEDVSFGYKSYRKVLKNINQSVKKGEMIGLVGHSGSGKSTMINLIMRLYNPDNGEIKLDGKNLSEYNEREYKNILGVVLQENYLFGGSILDNIRYAKPQATMEECILAAKAANAHDFIMTLPDGYNTFVGEKGYKLSGGERQRISIARAVITDPAILILDEATASVDTQTEVKIQDALSRATEGKTVFAIAHRLSTLKNADRLFVLEEGRIAESGPHAELLQKNGIYASLFRAQQQMTQMNVTIDNSNLKEESTVVFDNGEEFKDE